MLAKSAAPTTSGAVAQLPAPAAAGRAPSPSLEVVAGGERTAAALYTETLALGDRLSAAYLSIQEVLPYFGKVTFKSEHSFSGVKEVLEHIGQSSYSQILMSNPYGNTRRIAIYEALKELSFPVIVFDRGALPNSWFFDGSFNADSITYHPLHWDRALSDAERQRVAAYVEEFRSSERMLEDQGPRLGVAETLDLLGANGKKVLLVPLQRPKDTTITHFSNLKHGLPDFLALVEGVCDLIEREGLPWHVVVKQHPLESGAITSKKFTVCPADCHIQSLVEAADMVLLVNSGVGVNAMLWEKPVLHVGQIFYGHPSLNRPVRDASDVRYYLENPFRVDPEKMQRFISHLIERVYSFGESQTELKAEEAGALRRVTRYIDFHKVRLPNQKKVLFVTSVLPIPIYRGSAQKTDVMIRTLQGLDLDVTLCVLNQSFKDKQSEAIAAELSAHYGIRNVTVRKHPKFHRGNVRSHRLYRLARLAERTTGGDFRLANEEACPRSFRRTVAKLCAGSPFDLIWVNYAKLLPAVPDHLRARAIVDTHDIQTTIFEAEQLPRYPRPLRPLLRELFWRSEARLLRKAPTLISINPRE